jgi:hypothetical protein
MNEHDEYGPLDVERAIDVMEKPWNFSTEYTEMVDAQESELEPLLASSLALARGAKGART